MSYTLKPCGKGSELLKPIIIVNNETTLRIGRDDNISGIITSATCTNYEYISRNHIELVFLNNILSMKSTARQDLIVYLNNRPCEKNISFKIQHNDIISLLGLYDFFNYQVLFEPEEILSNTTSSLLSNNKQTNQESTVNKQPNKTSSSSSSDIKNGIKLMKTKLLRQYECSICYETIACAMSVNPCGDNFCYSCISDWSLKHMKCPICQIDFQLSLCLPNRLTDNAIREILSTGVEVEEELKEWESRLASGIEAKKIHSNTITTNSNNNNNNTASNVINITSTNNSLRANNIINASANVSYLGSRNSNAISELSPNSLLRYIKKTELKKRKYINNINTTTTTSTTTNNNNTINSSLYRSLYNNTNTNTTATTSSSNMNMNSRKENIVDLTEDSQKYK